MKNSINRVQMKIQLVRKIIREIQVIKKNKVKTQRNKILINMQLRNIQMIPTNNMIILTISGRDKRNRIIQMNMINGSMKTKKTMNSNNLQIILTQKNK